MIFVRNHGKEYLTWSNSRFREIFIFHSPANQRGSPMRLEEWLEIFTAQGIARLVSSLEEGEDDFTALFRLKMLIKVSDTWTRISFNDSWTRIKKDQWRRRIARNTQLHQKRRDAQLKLTHFSGLVVFMLFGKFHFSPPTHLGILDWSESSVSGTTAIDWLSSSRLR